MNPNRDRDKDNRKNTPEITFNESVQIVDTIDKQGVKKEVTQVNISGTWKGTDAVYMSNNINPWTVMPLSPNQVNGSLLSPIIRADFIVPFTPGNTIQLEGTLNAGGGGTIPFNTSTLQYRTQSIYPFKIYDNTNEVFALASIVGTTTPTFGIGFATNQGSVNYTDAGVLFNAENVSSYTMRLNGSMGINIDPGAYALNINGSAKVSGSLDIGSVTVSTLGIGVTSVTPGYALDVSGTALFRNAITARQAITSDALITGNQLHSTLDANIGTTLLVNSTTELLGNVGIGQAATAYALDVLGQVNVSDTLFTNDLQAHNNLDMSGNLYVADHLLNASVVQGNVGIGLPPVQIQFTNNSLSVGGYTNLKKIAYLEGGLVIAEPTNYTLAPSLNLYVNGGSSLQGALTVGSPQSNAPSIFNGDVTVTGSLNSTGSSSQGSADISGNLRVSGTSTLNGTLDVSGTTLLRNTLTVGTALHPADMGISGTLDVSGTSLLTGNVGMSGTLDVSGAALITGNAGIYGSLDVSGTSLFTGNVGMSGTLDVSGTSLLTGNVGLSGTLEGSGAALITGNLNYNVYTERITYQSTPFHSVLPLNSPGYWDLSGNLINLHMPLKPTMYIIDGSVASSVDMSVNLVTSLPYTQVPGMTFTFVARNTTGTGHRIIYPYVTGTHSTLIATPISTRLVCIGNNDYSSNS